MFKLFAKIKILIVRFFCSIKLAKTTFGDIMIAGHFENTPVVFFQTFTLYLQTKAGWDKAPLFLSYQNRLV
jgi:hypothetical protein